MNLPRSHRPAIGRAQSCFAILCRPYRLQTAPFWCYNSCTHAVPVVCLRLPCSSSTTPYLLLSLFCLLSLPLLSLPILPLLCCSLTISFCDKRTFSNMPSFPLLKSKRPAQDQENQGFESAAKNRRRHSKRQFLRSLFTRYTGKERKSSSLFEVLLWHLHPIT